MKMKMRTLKTRYSYSTLNLKDTNHPINDQQTDFSFLELRKLNPLRITVSQINTNSVGN